MGYGLQELTANVSALLKTDTEFKLVTCSKQSHQPLLAPSLALCLYFLRELSTSRQKRTSKPPRYTVCPSGHHRPVDSCRPPAQGGCSRVAPPPALTYSTRWDWTQPAGRRCAHWALGRARGTPGARACSSGRYLSRLSAARCQRFGASGCLHSRCCTEESPRR